MSGESLLCLNCGSRKEFQRTAIYNEIVEEEQIFNGEGELIETCGQETVDSNFQEFDSKITCGKCRSTEVTEADEDEILKLMAQHTDNKEVWHKKELPEKQWNKKILMKMGAMKI
jgi:hypothetical protein